MLDYRISVHFILLDSKETLQFYTSASSVWNFQFFSFTSVLCIISSFYFSHFDVCVFLLLDAMKTSADKHISFTYWPCGWLLFFFLNWPFYLEVIVDSYAVVRNNGERFPVLFIWFLPVVLNDSKMSQPKYCHWHSQDIEHLHHQKDPWGCPFIAIPTSFLHTSLLLIRGPPLLYSSFP